MDRRYILLVPLLIWWIPLVGPLVQGFIIGSVMKGNIKNSLSYAILSSIIGSTVTSITIIKLIKVPLLGNLFPFFVILLNVIGSVICIFVSDLISSKGVFTVMTPRGMEMEFHVNKMDEIDSVLGEYVDPSMCSQPSLKFITEDNVEVSRDCGNIRLVYNVSKDGKKYLVKLRVESL